MQEVLLDSKCDNSKYACIKFTANWCMPCKKLEPKFNELVKNPAYATWCDFYSVDIDEYPKLATIEKVKSIPVTMFYAHGYRLDHLTVQGGDILGIEKSLNDLNNIKISEENEQCKEEIVLSLPVFKDDDNEEMSSESYTFSN